MKFVIMKMKVMRFLDGNVEEMRGKEDLLVQKEKKVAEH